MTDDTAPASAELDDEDDGEETLYLTAGERRDLQTKINHWMTRILEQVEAELKRARRAKGSA